jgi:glycopeptide antibiotics resistance protein
MVCTHLYFFSKKGPILAVSDKCVIFEINATFYLQVMVKMTLFSLLLGSVQESAYTMLRHANA